MVRLNHGCAQFAGFPQTPKAYHLNAGHLFGRVQAVVNIPNFDCGNGIATLFCRSKNWPNQVTAHVADSSKPIANFDVPRQDSFDCLSRQESDYELLSVTR
jgi:hypothetical protein